MERLPGGSGHSALKARAMLVCAHLPNLSSAVRSATLASCAIAQLIYFEKSVTARQMPPAKVAK